MEVMFGRCGLWRPAHSVSSTTLLSDQTIEHIQEIVAWFYPQNPKRGEGFAYFCWMCSRTENELIAPVQGTLAIWPVSLRKWNLMNHRRLG